MGLFGFGKKKENESCGCGCGCEQEKETSCGCGTDTSSSCGCSCGDVKLDYNAYNDTPTGEISMKILGGGCANCHKLQKSTEEAVQALNIDAKVEAVTDFAEIATYGVMSTPALVIGQKVVSSGKALSTAEVTELLKNTFSL